jgi:predicted dehydrogenase
VIGRKHLEAATKLPNVTVAAVADLDAVCLARTSAEFGIGKKSTDAADLIRDPDIDGIVLAVPTGVRTPLALDVLGHRKHLLVEKPVAMNAGEVRTLIDAQEGKVGGCCSCRFRFLRNTAAVQSTLASDRIGKLRTVRVRALTPPPTSRPGNPPPWRLNRKLNGGGILVNWGCYDLDYILGVLGWSLQPVAITARTFRVPEPYADWIAPGSDAETHVIAHPGKHEFSWSFSGDRGTLSILFGDDEVRTSIVTADKEGALKEVSLGKEPLLHSHLHAGPVTDFARAIDTGGSPMTPLTQALTIARITDAIYASGRDGGREIPIEKNNQP